MLFVLCLGISISGLTQQKSGIPDTYNEIHNYSSLSEIAKMDTLYQIGQINALPDKTIYFANESLHIAKKLQDTFYLANNYTIIGVAYRLKGDTDTALDYQNKALKLITGAHISNAANIYTEIANTYIVQKKYNLALQYQRKAFKLQANQKQYHKLIETYLALAKTNYLNNQPALAAQLLDSAQIITDTLKGYYGIKNKTYYTAHIQAEHALLLKKQHHFTAAIAMLNEAINTMAQINDSAGALTYNLELAALYNTSKQTNKAITHTAAALAYAKQANNIYQLRDISEKLSDLYSQNENYEQSLKYYTSFLNYRDSITNTNNTRKMANLKTDFEVSLKQQEIEALEKEKFISTISILVTILLFVLALVILIFFWQRWKNMKLIAETELKKHNENINNLIKGQETKALQAMVIGQENERKRLAKDLHNHLGSLLAAIRVNLNNTDNHNPENLNYVKSMVDQACSDIKNLSHSLNLGISDDFGLKPALEELVGYLKQIQGLAITFHTSIDNLTLGLDSEVIIYRIIQELVSNALKHAQASELIINVTFNKANSSLTITVEDNGKGFNINTINKKKSGIGLQSLHEMAAQLNGNITINSAINQGTSIKVDIPLTLNSSSVI